MLRDATQKPLFEALEKNDVPYSFNKAENTLFLKRPRSTVLFRSMEEFERLRGTNLAWFGLDELTYAQEEAWLRLEGRLRDPGATRRTGFAVWTPKGFDWVYRKFVRDETDNYHVTIAKPFENKHLLDKVPDFYDRLRKSYDEQFYQQEVMGCYLNMSGGLVYRNFRREEHMRERAADESAPLLWALDFNVDPMCSVIVQGTDEGVQVLDEIVISRATTEMACQEFHSRWGTHKAGFRIPVGLLSEHSTRVIDAVALLLSPRHWYLGYFAPIRAPGSKRLQSLPALREALGPHRRVPAALPEETSCRFLGLAQRFFFRGAGGVSSLGRAQRLRQEYASADRERDSSTDHWQGGHARPSGCAARVGGWI
jgi:hypothetical protein